MAYSSLSTIDPEVAAFDNRPPPLQREYSDIIDNYTDNTDNTDSTITTTTNIDIDSANNNNKSYNSTNESHHSQYTSAADIATPSQGSSSEILTTADNSGMAEMEPNGLTALWKTFVTYARTQQAFSAEQDYDPQSQLASDSESTSTLNYLWMRLRQKQWHFRPVPLFVAPVNFARPRTSAEAMARIESNLAFYKDHYIVVCSVIALASILTEPVLLLLFLALILMWSWASKRNVIHIGSTSLTGRTKSIVLSSISVLSILLFAGGAIISITGVCIIVVLAHAALNTRGGLNANGEDELTQAFGSQV